MLKKLFCIASLCSLVWMTPLAHAANDTDAVTSAAEKLRVLMVTPDREALNSLVAEELNYGHSNVRIDTKESFTGDLMSGASDFLTIDLTEQTVSIVDDVALVRHTLTGNTADKGKAPGTVKLKILLVWKKQGGEWKLLARQAVRV